MKARLAFSILCVIALLLVSGSAAASPQYDALGTGFTYQGRLTDGGAPANGTYDFEFRLYNSEAEGTGEQMGVVTKDDVTVSDGLFTVQLDFGNVFDGTALYLEIGVRPGDSTGAYTTLSPRQPLTATPYALYAFQAPWSGLTGMESGAGTGLVLSGSQFSVDTNVIQQRVTGACTSGNAIRAVDANGTVTCEPIPTIAGTPYQNVVVVAKSGGDYTSIQAALNSITDVSESNPYLIWVAPGVYTEKVTMKPYVDIEGSGELATKITYTGDPSLYAGTVEGVTNAELRFLTVESVGGATHGVAIFNDGASPRLTHVTASASATTGKSYGVYNYLFSSPVMADVTVRATGGQYSYGVLNEDFSSPAMNDVLVDDSGATTANLAVYNKTNSSPTMTDVTASASGGTTSYGVYNEGDSRPAMINVTASASGGTNNYGVYNTVSSPTITNGTASASGGSQNTGVYNYFSSPTIQNSAIGASGGASNVGIFNLGSGYYTVLVNDSQVTGSTNTISNTGGTILVGASQLSGGVVLNTAGGTLTCAGVYDENYVFYPSTCP
jgi:hypothetical protein